MDEKFFCMYCNKEVAIPGGEPFCVDKKGRHKCFDCRKIYLIVVDAAKESITDILWKVLINNRAERLNPETSAKDDAIV
jgi:hypothetical protein